MVCAGVSRPKHYATIRHFQHETPDSPTHASMHLHICVIFRIPRENGTKQRRLERTVSTRTEVAGDQRSLAQSRTLARTSALFKRWRSTFAFPYLYDFQARSWGIL